MNSTYKQPTVSNEFADVAATGTRTPRSRPHYCMGGGFCIGRSCPVRVVGLLDGRASCIRRSQRRVGDAAGAVFSFAVHQPGQ